MKRDIRPKASATQIIEVRKGLYALRYVSAVAGKAAPQISVEPDSDAEIELIGMPGAKYATLSKPSDVLIVRAFGSAQIRIQVTPAHEGGSIIADVRLEDLLSIGVARSEEPGSKTVEFSDFADPIIEILGHLSRVGDVVAGPREWIAGLTRPRDIEGVRISWVNKPSNVELIVEGVLGGRAQGKSAPTCADGLIGSRGRAIPLVGLNLRLSGVGAPRYNLIVESLFRGCRPIENSGRSIELSGPTETEALIGLKVDIQVVGESLEVNLVKISSGGSKDPIAVPNQKQARVKVFKRSS